MKKIDINLSTYKYQSTAIALILAVSVFFAAALYSVYNVYTYGVTGRQAAIYEKEIKRLRADVPSDVPRLNREEVQALAKKVALVNSVIIRKSFSWTEFLSDFEQTVPKRNISIVDISPSFRDGAIHVKGAARRMKDVLKFVDMLSGSSEFSGATLEKVTEQKKPKSGTLENLVFTLSVTYVGSVDEGGRP